MARFLSMERREAAKFSMLLSIPAIIAAASLVAFELYQQEIWLLSQRRLMASHIHLFLQL